jgi:anti-anti-sigma factor
LTPRDPVAAARPPASLSAVNIAEEPLRVDVSSTGTEVLLVLSGELDPHTAPALRQRIDETTDESVDVLVLDVSGLRFIDSSGLRVIISAHKEMAARDGHLVLRSPTETTRRLLDITGLTDHIDID